MAVMTVTDEQMNTKAPGEEIRWLSTAAAAKRLGITNRTLYRFIDEGQVAAYRFGRVIRLQLAEVHEFIERCRIQPGSLEHLYPESVGASGSHDE
jgi:excisionase family DNA binding protein